MADSAYQLNNFDPSSGGLTSGLNQPISQALQNFNAGQVAGYSSVQPNIPKTSDAGGLTLPAVTPQTTVNPAPVATLPTPTPSSTATTPVVSNNANVSDLTSASNLQGSLQTPQNPVPSTAGVTNYAITSQAQQQANQQYDTNLSPYTSIIDQYKQAQNATLGKGQYTLDQNNVYGVNNLRSTVADLTNQINANDAANKTAQVGYGLNVGGVTASSQQAFNAEADRANAVKQLTLGASLSAAQNNLALANQFVTQAVDAKYKDAEQQVANLKDYLTVNAPLLQRADKQAYDAQVANVAAKEADLAYQKTQTKSILDIATEAAKNGADATTLANINNSKNPQDAISAAGTYLRDYSNFKASYPGQSFFDPITKQTYQVGGGSTTPTDGSKIVGGVDWTGYATSPTDIAGVQANLGQIQAIAPNGINDANTAQQVIQGISPNSPITGAMIMNTATKYGVDPSTILARIQQESLSGTAGKGAGTFNPGNVGNDDTGKTVNYGNWQAGLDAVGQWASQHDTTKMVNSAAQNYNLALTPTQAVKFNSLADSQKGDVAGLLLGTTLPSNISTKNNLRDTAINLAKQIDPNYDSVTQTAGQTFLKSRSTQTFIANANTANKTLDTVSELVNKLGDQSDLTAVNKLVNSLGLATSNVDTTNFFTAHGLLADELGKVLGSGAGSDFAIQLGQSLVSPNASAAAKQGQIQLLKGRLANKIAEYKAQGDQGTDPSLNASNTSNSTPKTASSTGGGSYQDYLKAIGQ